MHETYFKNCKKGILLLAIVAISHTSNSQVDVTSKYLENPSFENETEGWNLFGFTDNAGVSSVQGNLEKSFDGGFFDGSKSLEKWVDASMADTYNKPGFGVFDVSQTIDNLPAGKYRFTMAAKAINQSALNSKKEISNLFFYVNGDTVRISTPELEDQSNLIPDRWAPEPFSELFTIEYAVANGSDIKVGIGSRTIKEGEIQANWVCFDNFKIYLLESDDMRLTYRDEINNLLEPYTNEEYVMGILGSYRIQLEFGGTLYDELEKLESNQESTVEQYSSLHKLVLDITTAAEETRPVMLNMLDKITEAYIVLDEFNFPGSNILEDIILKFEDVYYNIESTLEDIKKAPAQIDDAIFEYKLSNTIITDATELNPVDVTYLIGNPTIEKGVEADNRTKVDNWTIVNTTPSSWISYLAFLDDGNIALEAWHWAPSTLKFDYYQEFEKLPAGIYTLKANARGNQGTPNGKAVVYATAAIEKTVGIYNPLVLGIGESEDEMSEYEINEIFVNDGKLRIGFKNIGELENQWTICDDFQLIYYGNENEVKNYQNSLQNVVDKAKLQLQEEEQSMLYNDFEIFRNAIENAEKFLVSESVVDIVESITNLEKAMDEANEAILLLTKFKNGEYKKVAEYDGEEQLMLIAEVMLNNVDAILSDKLTTDADLENISLKLESLLLLFNEYNNAIMDMELDIYDIDQLEDFYNKITDSILPLETGNLDLIEKSRDDLFELLLDLRKGTFNGSDIFKDVTYWVRNNSFESQMSSWINENMAIQNNNSFAEKTGSIYCEKWANPGKNIPDSKVYQTIIVPEGMYKIKVDASVSQGSTVEGIDGIYLFACNGNIDNAKYRESITNQYIETPKYDTIYIVEDGVLTNEIDQIIVTEKGNLTREILIASNNGKITIGVEADNATCNYLRFDNFVLEYAGAIPNGVEEINKNIPFTAYSRGKQIYVSGVVDYNVYSANGQKVNPKSQLASGLYIINAEGISVKIVVE